MKKNVKIVLGGKWGDEGKGKIASRESKDAKLVIRATGGANAGHTIVFEGKKNSTSFSTWGNSLSTNYMSYWTRSSFRYSNIITRD